MNTAAPAPVGAGAAVLPPMTSRALAFVAAIAVLASATTASGPASAAGWPMVLQSSSKGEAQAQALPAAPAGPAAACVSSTTKTIKVTWTAVAHATAYLTYQSNTTVGGTYTVTSGGTYAGTTWTSATLAAGHYWYEVAAEIGTHWTGTRSVATGSTTIATTTPNCSQP